MFFYAGCSTKSCRDSCQFKFREKSSFTEACHNFIICIFVFKFACFMIFVLRCIIFRYILLKLRMFYLKISLCFTSKSHGRERQVFRKCFSQINILSSKLLTSISDAGLKELFCLKKGDWVFAVQPLWGCVCNWCTAMQDYTHQLFVS